MIVGIIVVLLILSPIWLFPLMLKRTATTLDKRAAQKYAEQEPQRRQAERQAFFEMQDRIEQSQQWLREWKEERDQR